MTSSSKYAPHGHHSIPSPLINRPLFRVEMNFNGYFFKGINMFKTIKHTGAIIIFSVLLAFFSPAGSFLFGAELTMDDIDHYLHLISSDELRLRLGKKTKTKMTIAEFIVKLGKNDRIILEIVSDLESGQPDDTIIMGLQSVNDNWNVDKADINLVRKRFDELLALKYPERKIPFPGITSADVDHYVQIYSEPYYSMPNDEKPELFADGNYSPEEYFPKFQVVGFITAAAYDGVPDEKILELLKEKFPWWKITQKDVDTVLAQREQILKIAEKITREFDYQ
jgi:hypothetical protein